MEQRTSWEANLFSAGQEIPRILWNPEGLLPHSQEPVNCPYSDPEKSSPCSHSTSWRSILILSSHLRLGLPSGLFPQGFPTKTQYTPPISPMRFMPTYFPLYTLYFYFYSYYIHITHPLYPTRTPLLPLFYWHVFTCNNCLTCFGYTYNCIITF